MIQSKNKKWSKKLKQNSYKWHRTLGIITIIPVIFWCISGLMHPIMAHWFKPSIAHEKLEAQDIDTTQIKLSLKEVLEKNNIDIFKNFHIVTFNNKVLYQIKTTVTNEILYFDANTGKALHNGDALYAQWLSRYFLDDQNSKIKTAELVTKFNGQYKYVNRYLPVWKVVFDREDNMDVYVETSTGKLATYNPTSRKIQLWIFDTFHNWSFLEAISNNAIRIIVMIILLCIISASAISGLVIYGFFWKVFKKTPVTDNQSKFKKHHRKIGIAVAFVTFCFSFSGGYHALKKWNPYTLDKMVYSPNCKTKDLSGFNIFKKADSTWASVGIIKYKNNYYYQIALKPIENQEIKNNYFDQKTGALTPNIEINYAVYLANSFANKMSTNQPLPADCCEVDNNNSCIKNAKLLKTDYLFDFDKREYGFVNKRLPVIKLSYNTPDQATFYIEPLTSRLAAKVTNADRSEGYSFAILHKFLFMDWAGKNIRDLVMALSALGVLVVSILGLYLFLVKK